MRNASSLLCEEVLVDLEQAFRYNKAGMLYRKQVNSCAGSE